MAFWNALESGDEARATHIYEEMAPMFFFEAQLAACYKEVLSRRGVIDSPCGATPGERSTASPRVTSTKSSRRSHR